MGLIFKIASRNLWRHRGQSFVVGTILFIGALIMTVGNGVISGMEEGLHKTIVRSFTGDLVLVAKTQESDNVFLEMMGKAVEPLEIFPEVAAALKGHPDIEGLLPVGKNMVMVLSEDAGMPSFLYLIGVDFVRYRAFFPENLNLIEGGVPPDSGPGLLLPAGARKEVLKGSNTWFIPKNSELDTTHLEPEDKKNPADLHLSSSMVMMGFNQDNSATDIRLDVNGVFKYRALNTLFGHFALVDIDSYRQCLGYFRADEKEILTLSPQDSALFNLEGENLDALFSGDEISPIPNNNNPKTKSSVADPTPAMDTVNNKAGLASSPEDKNRGTYNMVLTLLHPGRSPEAVKPILNKLFKEKNLAVRAVTWREALGPVGSMASLIKGALFVFVSFLFIVAVIIIINTLSMAALERISEIGMMRAIGAHKQFISIMFLAETGVLAALFGGLGIVVGALIVLVLPWFNITSQNDMLQLFFGGDSFHPLLTVSDFVLAIFQLSFVSLIAVAYPLWVARSITPLDAVYKE